MATPDRHNKELWELRFRRILELEIESYLFYKRLIQENGELLSRMEARDVLEKIMREELQHAKKAQELVRMIKSETAAKG